MSKIPCTLRLARGSDIQQIAVMSRCLIEVGLRGWTWHPTRIARALRGRELSYDGIPVVVTWHPAFLLRDPSRKPETWQDIKRVNRMLGRPEDPRQAKSAEA